VRGLFGRIPDVRRHYWERRYRRRFSGGDWATRTRPLFELGVDYRGKTILDAGCNIGIVGYELSKQQPSFYHGIDVYRPALKVAEAIFSGVDIGFRFDQIDLSDAKALSRKLQPSYDIVLLLHVFKYLIDQSGEAAARRSLATLANRCADRFIVNGFPVTAEAVADVMTDAGLFLEHERAPAAPGKSMWRVFKRRETTKTLG